MALYISASGHVAGSHASIAIYNVDSNRHPTTTILESGSIDTSTDGYKTVTVNQFIPAGVYVMATWFSGACGCSCTISNVTDQTGGLDLNAQPPAYSAYQYVNQTWASTFPDLTSVTLSQSTSAPYIPLGGIR